MSGTKTPARHQPQAKPREMTPATVEQVQIIKHELDRYTKVVTKLLARSEVSSEEFLTWVGNAMRATPDLWKCEPATVVGAALRCAQLNLAPNDGSSLAWIIPYGRNATFQLGYGGVIELARRAVPGLKFEGRPVYPGDLFSLDYGRQPPLKHVPYHSRRPRKAKGGDAELWYVKVTYPDGHIYVHALDRDGVEYHHKFSKMKNGMMWTDAYDAAALKSVVFEMRRWLPHTPELTTGMRADGAVVDARAMNQEAPELPTPAEAEIGAGTVDDDEIADGELEPDDPTDAAWIAQAKDTDTEETPT